VRTQFHSHQMRIKPDYVICSGWQRWGASMSATGLAAVLRVGAAGGGWVLAAGRDRSETAPARLATPSPSPFVTYCSALIVALASTSRRESAEIKAYEAASADTSAAAGWPAMCAVDSSIWACAYAA